MEDDDKTLPIGNSLPQDETLLPGNYLPPDNFPPPANFPPQSNIQIPAPKQPKRTLIIVGGVIVLVLIILGVSAFTFLPGLLSANHTTPTPTPIATAMPKKADPYAIYLKQYGPDIKAQIAQGLHLTPNQMIQQLKDGQSIDAIAKTQNVSPDQLNTLIATAFQNGLKPAVDAGGLTQKQVDALVKRVQKNHKMLDNFLGLNTKKKQSGTPTATATANP